MEYVEKFQSLCLKIITSFILVQNLLGFFVIPGREGKFFLFNTPDTSLDYFRAHLNELYVRDQDDNEVSFEGTLYLGNDETEIGNGYQPNFINREMQVRNSKVII